MRRCRAPRWVTVEWLQQRKVCRGMVRRFRLEFPGGLLVPSAAMDRIALLGFLHLMGFSALWVVSVVNDVGFFTLEPYVKLQTTDGEWRFLADVEARALTERGAQLYRDLRVVSRERYRKLQKKGRA